MKIKMELLSDAIFGNGMSVPGGEDISVLHDKDGFPYYKGTTFKGVFREELERYLKWTNSDIKADDLLGRSGENSYDDKLVFSDFTLSEAVKKAVLDELSDERGQRPTEILDLLTELRTFTAINDNGIADEGSLRIARCVKKGLVFYSEIFCDDKNKATVEETLGFVKWIGTMRNRGFGKVKISRVEV